MSVEGSEHTPLLPALGSTRRRSNVASGNPGSQIVGRTFFVDGVVGFMQAATQQSRDKEVPHMSPTFRLRD